MGVLLILDSWKAYMKPELEYVAPFYWLVLQKEKSLSLYGLEQSFDLFFNSIWNCFGVKPSPKTHMTKG